MDIETLRKVATIEIEIEPEEMEVRGNLMCSDEPDLDRKYEDEIIDRLDRGDTWAWCCVRVVAEYEGVRVASHFLGGCSYADEKDFRAEETGGGGYYTDMCDAALEELAAQINGRVWTGTAFTRDEAFMLDETRQLARLIHKRWGGDMAAAAVAWRRLFQNSATDADFAELVKGPQEAEVVSKKRSRW